KTDMKAYGTVFNDIFYDNNPALSPNTINKKHLDKFSMFMEEINDKIDINTFHDGKIGMTFCDYESIWMKNNGVNRYNIIAKPYESDKENISETLNNKDEVFMIVKNPTPGKRAKFHIDDEVYFR